MPKATNIPANYQTVMPYLIIKFANRFIDFVEKVFDAPVTHIKMRDEKTIMHAEAMIGECTIMFADATEKFEPKPAGMFVYVKNADETYAKAIEAGATELMPVTDMPYGRSGGVEDPFGNQWWITMVIE